MPIRDISIDLIRADGGTQGRVAIKPDVVAEYAELVADEVKFPPIDAVHDGSVYWLFDGFHRLAAHRKAGLETIAVNVIEGTQRDAILRAAGANAEHGVRRTEDDKRRAVELLLNDPEWAGKSDRWIAENSKVSPTFVGRIRNQVSTWTPEARTGRDGKQYPARRAAIRERETEPATSEDWLDSVAQQCGDEIQAFNCNDLEAWQRDGVTVEEAVERIKGTAMTDTPADPIPADVGKSPPAEKPSGGKAHESSGVTVDGIGCPVPEHLQEHAESAIKFAEIVSRLDRLKKDIRTIAEAVGGDYLRASHASYEGPLFQLRSAVKLAAYWTSCKKCGGDGCNSCRFAGFWPQHRKSSLSVEERGLIEDAGGKV